MCLCLTTPTTVATGTALSVNNDAVDISSTSPTSGEVSTAINARVAERTLRINIPNEIMQHNSISMESLFTAVLDPLGGDRCRILSSLKQRQNSHSIVVTLDGDRLVWTWPELLWNYIGCSVDGWVPTQGPSPEGVSSKHIQLQQFCDIANRGALVSATADNKLQLRFHLNVVQTTSSSEIIKCDVSKSSLSPEAPAFEYSAGVNDFNPSRFILSPSAESFTPVPINTTNIIINPIKKTLSPSAEVFTPPLPVAKVVKCVHFPPVSKEVTAVFTRPITTQNDISALYYSTSDFDRFRKELKLSFMDDLDDGLSVEQAIDDKSESPTINFPTNPPLPTSSTPTSNTVVESTTLSYQSAIESKELGEYVSNDVAMLKELEGDWDAFVSAKRGRGDIGMLRRLHPANRLLNHYKKHGAPVRLSTPDWTMDQLIESVERGPHKSCDAHVDFLQEEFIDMIKKGQWVVLPFSVAKTLPGLRLSPAGVVEQRDRRPRWIGDYSFYGVNDESQPFAAVESMQFGHALERFLRELLLANPALGPIYLAKTDVSDGFYRIDLAPSDIPKLGLLFPQVSESNNPDDQLIALPLVLPMGWKYSPPIFTTVTETVADNTNAAIASGEAYRPHPLEPIAAELDEPLVQPTLVDQPDTCMLVDRPDTNTTLATTLDTTLAATLDATLAATLDTPLASALDTPPAETLDRNKKIPTKELDFNTAKSPLGAGGVSSKVSPSTPLDETLGSTVTTTTYPPRDSCLPCDDTPIAMVEVFVDDFIKAAQGESTRRRVRSLLFHALDDALRPNDFYDNLHRREPNSLKKLRKGDCSWSQIKQILGWIINTASMTISLPEHRVERLAEILASIPATQKRTSVRKWHKVLGELRSMSLALPGSRNLFSHMQHAMSSRLKGRVNLNKGVHGALEDFRWMLDDIKQRPTRIAELVPLLSSAEGHHDASGHGAGGVWFPSEHLIAREGFDNQPIVWRLKWPQYIIDRLVTSDNPDGTISNSDLELAGGLLHLEALSQTFDIRERTVLSKTDNLNTLFWQRKGSATTDKVPAHLLRMFGIHQRFHRYVPRHDYLAGPSNPIADALSRDFEQSWQELFESLKPYLPEDSEPQVWDPSPKFVSAVIASLLKTRQPPSSFLIEPPAASPSNPSPCQTQIQWPSTPLSKPSNAKYETYKKSDEEFKSENLLPSAIPSGLDRLKVTYGTLKPRPVVWGPKY